MIALSEKPYLFPIEAKPFFSEDVFYFVFVRALIHHGQLMPVFIEYSSYVNHGLLCHDFRV